jgi:hypothetical protein
LEILNNGFFIIFNNYKELFVFNNQNLKLSSIDFMKNLKESLVKDKKFDTEYLIINNIIENDI